MSGIPEIDDRVGPDSGPEVPPISSAYAGLPPRAQRLLTLYDATNTPVTLDGKTPICAFCRERYDASRARESSDSRPHLCQRCYKDAQIITWAIPRPVRWSPKSTLHPTPQPLCLCNVHFTASRANDKTVLRPWLCRTSDEILEAKLRVFARMA